MKLVDVAEKILTGQIISRVEAKEEIGDVVAEERQVLVPKAISNGRIIQEDLGSVKLKKVADEERLTQKGDIVLKLSTPYDAVYITQDNEGLLVPSFCAVIRGVSGKVDAEFITAYLNTDYVREILKSTVSGSAMPIIKVSNVRELELPNIELAKQELLGQAYSISCQKQDVLRELLSNEQTLINNIVLNAVKEAI